MNFQNFQNSLSHMFFFYLQKDIEKDRDAAFELELDDTIRTCLKEMNYGGFFFSFLFILREREIFPWRRLEERI